MTSMNHLSGLRPLVGALAAAGLAALVLAGCSQANSKPADAPKGPPPVATAAVIEKSVNETQEFSGRLEAVERVDIRARVSGFITQVNFKPGSEVKKGDVLFVIDPRPYEAEADRTNAAANAARAKAELAKTQLDRAQRLLADKAISQQEFDERAADLKELEATARSAQAAFEAARLNVSYTRVIAPISGRVSKEERTLGNLVDANVLLTSMVSDGPIYASFDGDEATYLRVGQAARRGQKVTVRVGLANEDGFPHEGKLEFVDNRLDVSTGSARMRAVLDNSDQALAPGLYARVQIGGAKDSEHNAILIADRAVSTDQDRKFVYVIGGDNKAEYREVVLGPTVDGLRVVRSGVKQGERVVVGGLQRVKPGKPVTPELVPMVADASNTSGAPTLAAAKTTSKE
jgi:multidrug efflux system membrane fusion protein